MKEKLEIFRLKEQRFEKLLTFTAFLALLIAGIIKGLMSDVEYR